MVDPDLNIDKQTAFDNNIKAGVAIDTDQVPDEAKRMGGAAGLIRKHINTGPETVKLSAGPTGKLATAKALDTTVADWVKWGNGRAGDVTTIGDVTRQNGEEWVDTDVKGQQDYGGGDFGATPTTLPSPRPQVSPKP